MNNQNKTVTNLRANLSACQYQHLLDSLLAVVIIIDNNGIIEYVNEACLSIWGYSPEEITGSFYLDIVAEEDCEKTKTYFDQQLSGTVVQHFENHFRHKSGTLIPASWAGRWEPMDKKLYCVIRDISERKQLAALQLQLENELKKRNRDMNEMLQRITDGFFVLDKEWRFTYANSRAEQIVGIPVEAVLKKTLWECFPGTVGTVFEAYYRKAVAEQVALSFESYYPEPLNMWVEINAYPSPDGLSVFFRNINDRKSTELERNTYEQKIKEQHTRFTETLERITDAFFTVDKNWVVTYWNQQAEHLTGKRREAVLSKSIWESFPDAAGSVLGVQFKKAQVLQTPVFFEAFSTVCPILLQFSVYPSPNGLSVFYRDITEDRKAEEEIQRLSLIAKETANAVWMQDADGTITWVNEAFIWVTGYALDEALGKKAIDLFSGPDTDVKIIQAMQKAMEEQRLFSGDVVYYTKEKKKLYVHLSVQPIFDHQGTVTGYFAIQTDFTEQKKTGEEFHKLSLIVKQTMNAVSLVDVSGAIVWVNEAFTNIFEYQAEEAVGQKNSVLLSGEGTSPKTLAYMLGCFRQGQPFSGEIVGYTKTKKKKWLATSGQPIFDSEGKVEQYFIIHNDVTERKRLEKELETQRRKTTAAVITAQEQERAQVGRELHDNVNQVLTTVKLYQELCVNGIGNIQELSQKSIDLLQYSINEIRNLSKRLSVPSLENNKLHESVRELLDTIGATNKLHINLDAAAIENLEVDHDVHLAVYRILQEHFTNILRYAHAQQVTVKLEAKSGNLILEVYDNGSGFDTKQKRKGVGITNMINRAESLKGSVTINSAPGKGCQLLVQLPLEL